MSTFATEFCFVLCTLAGLGVAGGFTLVPFRRSLPFALLAAPLAGLLCMALGIAGFYSVMGWSLLNSAKASGIVCGAATLISLLVTRPRLRWKQAGWALSAVVLVAGVVTRTVDAATIQLHGAAILYCDGTDHMGYAQAADWLMAHPLGTPPRATPQQPYAEWLTILWRLDPRFGSYFYFGLIAMLRHVHGPFAYDSAAAVALAAAILGVAAVFTRSRLSLTLLLVGLLVSHWYDYGRIGFLAKTIGYPAALMLVGLFFSLTTPIPPGVICALAMLTSATALTHSGLATALFICVAVGPYLICRYALERRSSAAARQQVGQQATVAALLVGIAIVTTGVLARPVQTKYPNWNLPWSYILPRVIDLEHQGAGVFNDPVDNRPPLLVGHQENLVSGLGENSLLVFAGIGIAMWICLAGIALIYRDPAAIGLLIGPLLLLAVLRLLDDRGAAFQLIGVPYPFMLCGAARLIDGATTHPVRARYKRALSAAAIVLTIILVGLRVPRYAGSVRRYAGSAVPKAQRFSLRQTDRLAEAIGSEAVEVDTPSYTHAIFVLVELGKRGLHLQWTPQSWNTVLSYSGWPPPQYPPAHRRLVLASQPIPPGWRVICRAQPFYLLADSTVSAPQGPTQ